MGQLMTLDSGVITINNKMVRVGVVGFGHLGQYLVDSIRNHPDLELAWVWNRSSLAGKIEDEFILDDLNLCDKNDPDVIVEVAHPEITRKFGPKFLSVADYMIGSPTALADRGIEASLEAAATKHGLYIPSGALWGGEDIRKMAERGTLTGLTVTMRKHPDSFKLEAGDLRDRNAGVEDTAVELYHGPVRGLCPLAPNNVNTMAAAAVAASNLGFDKTIGRLVADPNIPNWHVVEVEVTGPVGPGGNKFSIKTVRSNPAAVGAVTGSATYASFLSSLVRVGGKGKGFHIC